MRSDFFNSVLGRWARPAGSPAPSRDCGACARPLKCCDFQPFFANFLVGAWLEREGLSELPRLAHGEWQPIGLVARREYRERRRETPAPRTADLLCGFYRAGRCGVWEFRPGECASYFCESERPEIAARAFALEAGVAQMALAVQAYSPARIAAQVDWLNEGAGPAAGAETAVAVGTGAGAGVGEVAGAESAAKVVSEDLIETYRAAWRWAQGLSREEVESWKI